MLCGRSRCGCRVCESSWQWPGVAPWRIGADEEGLGLSVQFSEERKDRSGVVGLESEGDGVWMGVKNGRRR